MKYLSVIVGWVFFATSRVLSMEAEDCVVYEGKHSDKSPPTKTMYRQISTGVLRKGDSFAATLSLTSQISNEKCDVKILSPTLAISCPGGTKIYHWSPDIFKYQDITELWLHLGPLGGSAGDGDEEVSTDLAIIGRRGVHRGHILFPSSGLQPPVDVRWEPMQAMDYYYNCVTGCLYTKNVMTPSGVHSFYFRPGPKFNHLSITYNSTEHRNFHELSLNSSDFTIDDAWKKVTVVWNNLDGDIGVMVNDHPIRGLASFSDLNAMSGVEAEIRGGEGLLKLCEEGFKEVADTRNVEEFMNESALASSATSPNEKSPDDGRNWLVLVALVCIALLVFMATVLVILLLKTKRDLLRERNASLRNENAMDTLDGTRKGTSKGNAPLYQDARCGGLDSVNNSSSRDSIDGLKDPAASLAPNSNANRYSSNGSKT